ncbi:DUF6366 family protein [Peribacillus sp. Bi134]|uniref:DUF6366 family protein n=1 Tax=Peribacillus sp. Bi134 TaxID=2884272 RepID=UPI001D76F297|nr:DUF6366 family protein [Peribacillus sp. Bi134]CAH0314885.1 hypothetical protein SRABI134_05248 [Peribacillus sp. Bi134]
MNNHNETPEEKRERLRQEELKKNPIGTLKDGFINLLQLKGTYFISRADQHLLFLLVT